jgi:SRSO17 transposase
VREAHKRIDPKLQPVPSDSGHEVACLLEPEVRAKIWRGLEAGEEPASLRRLAGAEPSRVPAATRATAIEGGS